MINITLWIIEIAAPTLSGSNLYAQDVHVQDIAGLKAQCAAIDSLVVAEFSKHTVGSVTVGVAYKNQLIWTKSYGNADMEKKVPAEKDTVYRIGSITRCLRL